MAALEARLVDREAGLLRLLDPPLVDAQPSAGYIQAYPPGVRENGGQYSHAGVWALMARAARGDGDAAYRYFGYLSPAHRSRHGVRGPAYAIEPYVMAGDVYSAPPYVGRGGWSWYTGSAAWMHRAAVESMFGVVQQGDEIALRPCLPTAWDEAEIVLSRAGRKLRVAIVRADGAVPSAPSGTRDLAVGERLRWSALPPESSWRIVLASPAQRVGGPSAKADAPVG
jgi:cyclic beta-1,2-glucan synthetase